MNLLGAVGIEDELQVHFLSTLFDKNLGRSCSYNRAPQQSRVEYLDDNWR